MQKFLFVLYVLFCCSRCFGDYVEIFDGPTIGTPRLGLYCDANTPNSPIVSSGNAVWIRFNSDSANFGTGFELEYQQSNQSIISK